MSTPKLNQETLPGLYQSADRASLNSQLFYFWLVRLYLIVLVVAASVSFLWSKDSFGAITSAALFLIALCILIALKVNRPDDTWYNARAVAESVKTRSWRWSMKAEPYNGKNDDASSKFIDDLKAILDQNRSLSKSFQSNNIEIQEPISEAMWKIRNFSVGERLEIYKEQRINDQAKWYAKKSQLNKRLAMQWFCISVILHAVAIAMLLYKIKDPTINLPVEVIATAAGSVLTWLQSKKFNELNSSYTLAAHEITLIKGEALSVKTEKELSEFVINSETAFSREHTQWVARKA